MFWKIVFTISPRLYLFDKNTVKTIIAKYYYSLNLLFFIEYI